MYASCTNTAQSRLAVARNANDESEVDESLLNAGLLTYPVLQAADVLAYKCVDYVDPLLTVFSYLIERRKCLWARTSNSTLS